MIGKREGLSTKENIEVLSLEQYLDLKSKGVEFTGQSYLFWEFVRILEEAEQKTKNPKHYVLVVPAYMILFIKKTE